MYKRQFKYFAMNFNALELKKLIATCYATSPVTGNEFQCYIDKNNQLSFAPSANNIPLLQESGRKPYKVEITEIAVSYTHLDVYKRQGDYIEHIDSTTNNFKYYTFAPRPLMNGNMYQMDDELATLLTEAHRNIGFLESLIQFAPNRDPFTELILLKECTYSRMIDYTGPNFKDVLRCV